MSAETLYARDYDGVVHLLYRYGATGPDRPEWNWLSGHVDARVRRVQMYLNHGVITCWTCLEQLRRRPDHLPPLL